MVIASAATTGAVPSAHAQEASLSFSGEPGGEADASPASEIRTRP